MEHPILEMLNINKSFGGVEVLHKIDFTLMKGEVHALVGQNGAGKSTLVKILNGVYSKDEGTIRINGEEIHYDSPIGARKYGLSMVFQEFSLVPTLTVAENVFLTREPRKNRFLLNDKESERRTRDLLNDIGVDIKINPNEYVEHINIGSRQIVEIAKALSQESKILILDEPTASLSHTEIESLFNVINNLRKKGISIIYISHYLKDIFKICDKVTVLRDGHKIFTKVLKETTMDEVINAMLGKSLDEDRKWKANKVERTQPPLLEVKNITTDHVKNISFKAWPGEIIGIAGLLGSGRTEILNAIFGIDPIKNGEILINGRRVNNKSTSDSIQCGIALVPEDRRNQGLIIDFSIKENLLLPILRRLIKIWLINDKEGKKIVKNYIDKFNIKAKNMEQVVHFLSGGNQQKVVVAKSMVSDSKILLLDDPTFGIDVKSKQEIMRIVRDFVNAGNCAILISSELDEIAYYCDRVLIVRKCEIIDTIENIAENEISEESLLKMIQ
jgi:ribose transport system ATP-binding protein